MRLLALLLLVGATLPGVAQPTAHARVMERHDAPPQPAPPSTLPDRPSRADLWRAHRERERDVMSCQPRGLSAQLNVRVTFESSGTVQEVDVNSTTVLPDSVTSCIKQALLRARVPPFRDSTYSHWFPFRY